MKTALGVARSDALRPSHRVGVAAGVFLSCMTFWQLAKYTLGSLEIKVNLSWLEADLSASGDRDYALLWFMMVATFGFWVYLIMNIGAAERRSEATSEEPETKKND